MIGHVANGPGDNDLLHSDTAVGGLVGGGLAGHLSRPLLDLPLHGKQPALPALATATLQDPPVLLLMPQLVRQAHVELPSAARHALLCLLFFFFQ